MAKITAGADWIAADALDIEPIKPMQWTLVQEPLRGATARPGDLQDGDPRAMEDLVEGLTMSGLAMQAASSSRPASGAEHQFSHLGEMEGLAQRPEGDEPPLSHGFKVGVGTVAIAALYERVLERDFAGLDTEAAVRAWPVWEAVRADLRGPRPRAIDPGRAGACAAQRGRVSHDPRRDRPRQRPLQDDLSPRAE